MTYRVQVYNRGENSEHRVNFVMSAYDADASYCRETGDFKVSYMKQGNAADISEKVPLSKLRLVPPGYNPLEVCSNVKLSDLKVGGEVEVQYKKYKCHPFG